MTKTFLITGGAGFLGINLTRYLLAKGCKVTSLDIAPFSYADVRDQVRAVDGDIRVMANVDAAMEGADIVVHAAAALPLYKPKDIFSTDIDGTKNVLASAFAHKVERAIHISSTAVYGIPERHPVYETDPLVGVGPYGEAKVKAEEICLEYRAKGMCIPIIRRSLSSVRSAWGCSHFCMSGQTTARIFQCLEREINRTSSSMSKTSAMRYGSAPRFQQSE